MSIRAFTYTVPSSIEGEPDEVAKVAIRQIQSLAAVVAELSTDTFVQLRAAGIDPDAENAVEAWLNTPEGRAASDLIWGAQMFTQTAQQL